MSWIPRGLSIALFAQFSEARRVGGGTALRDLRLLRA